ncbi:tartrate dehydrogenase [Cordyceps fumosorosea ARSEF 2679]|uniref:D-malate dehydrogenase (decarboxylating) n=1 Tax=Cordyceps fumosorosea (strain ARSEF 2679) TaxID=1081104 RepID=A0A167Q481_CORFA|nr:tartrate dehydrogenase [Cordyceps fumosorosea ARSEF 2679]OAA57270.1 tartrate dehydrogenase [Cordyceps fumosorosea ARSEF 2679]
MAAKALKIAVIPGDGIGTEVMPAGVRCLEAIGKVFNIAFEFEWFDFASCAYYQTHGTMLPADWKATLQRFDAIYFGAVGLPAVVSDDVSLWGSLLRFRRELDQYVNLRPCRLMPGVPSPLAGRSPGDVDFLVVRENTEGEYSSVGGTMFAGTDRELVVQETIMTRVGVDRIARYAFELASRRPRRHLTSATKSNGISITMPYWDARVAEMAKGFPEVSVDKYHIDILAAHMVQRPDAFDVIVASNLFGDILSDLGPACAGTIGIAPSANINPTGEFPSLFEPVHGSAPDIAGRGVANPVGMIWAGQMMLEHLGHEEAAAALLRAIEAVLARSDPVVMTPDMGGKGTTKRFGDEVEREILRAGGQAAPSTSNS